MSAQDRYILVQWRRGAVGDKFSLWLRRGAADYLIINWGGYLMQRPLDDNAYETGFKSPRYGEHELTLAQGEAAIMVARTVSSPEVWTRYAERIARGGEQS